MAIKDYFQFQFKKPTLSDEEKSKEKEAKEIQKSLEEAYSRLESIEILNANGKYVDSRLVCNELLRDLRRLSFEFTEKKPYSDSSVGQYLESLSNPSIKALLGQYSELVQTQSIAPNTSEEDMDKIEGSLADLLSSLEKHFKKIVKTELYTALDTYKARWKVQIGIVFLICASFVGSYLYNKAKNPDLTKSQFQIFLLEDKNSIPTEKFSKVTDVDISKKGEWVVYEFPATELKQLSGVRLDPTTNRKVRMTIESIQVMGDKNQVLLERKLDYDETGVPRGRENFGDMNDLKLAGKPKPNAPLEVESIGEDPYLTVFFETVKAPAKVLVKIRHLEAHKKFKD
jgi:hypothetical protein